MKNVLSITTLAIGVLILGTGCLKDKGFEAQEYGTQVTDIKAVAFPQNTASPVTLGLPAQSTPLIVSGPYITLESDQPASSDVTVNIGLNNTLATDAGLTLLPAGSVSLNTTKVIIPRGKKFSDSVKFNFPNTGILDPNKLYGIGLTIQTVDQGIKIASNQKDVVFAFTVKNKYDGNYGMVFKTVGWAAYGISDNLPGTWPSNANGTSIGMVTGGPNSVRLYDYWGFKDYIQPAFTTGNAGATGFGATAPRFFFDLSNDKLIDVVNDIPDDGRGRKFKLNTAVTTSRYDPATKKIYAAYILSQNGRPDMFIYDTLTYKSARP